MSDYKRPIKIPQISQELIEYLEKLFPNRAPSLGDNEKEVWYKAGQASVVVKLRHIKNQQDDTVLGFNNVSS